LTPKSSRDGIDGIEHLADGRAVLKILVRALPEAGAANDALIRLLAKTLALPASAITLQFGATSRLKSLRLVGDASVLAARLTAICGSDGAWSPSLWRQLLPAQAIVDPHHQCRAEERGQQIGDRDRGKRCDCDSGNEDFTPVHAVQTPNVFDFSVTQRHEFEITESEQVGVDDDEDDGVEEGNEKQKERSEVQDQRERGEFRREERHLGKGRRHARMSGVDFLFDDFGEFVEEKAADEKRDRRDGEGETYHESNAGQHHKAQSQPGRRQDQKMDEQPFCRDEDENKQKQGQRQRLVEDAAKRPAENLLNGGGGVVEDHGGHGF
jgi:uncharacterized protein YggU (UPF0235/DUF167 family)